jgi:hypothetical protein
MQPDETNIVDGPGLDEQWAKKNWLGKSLADAKGMFSSDSNHCYTEDFMYLSDLAVRYYLPAAIDYARSDQAAHDAVFVGGMAVSLARRLELQSLRPETAALAQEFARVVLSDLGKYDLDRNSPDDEFWIRAIESIVGSEL